MVYFMRSEVKFSTYDECHVGAQKAWDFGNLDFAFFRQRMLNLET